MKKYPKHQERTMLPPPRAKHLARRSFIPALGNPALFGINFSLIEICQGTKMNVNGDMNVHPATAAYRALKICTVA